MNDNRAPARPSAADEKRAHDSAVRLIAEKFGQHRERAADAPFQRMPPDYWDRRRALKEKRMDIE